MIKYYLLIVLLLSLSLSTFSQNLLKNITQSDQSSIALSILGADSKYSLSKGDTLFYLSSPESDYSGPCIWITNGTSSLNRIVSSNNYSDHSLLTKYKDKIYSKVGSSTLASTDGNSINYIHNFGYYDNIFFPHVLRDTLFFMVSINYGSGGLELWKTDGTSANTKKVTTITNQPFLVNYAPDGHSVTGNGKFYFSLSANGNGYEPWVTDGTASGTFLLKNISSGSNSSYPSYFTKVNSQVYFITESNSRLWKTDGTTLGTVQISNIGGSSLYRAHSLIEFNGYLYFMINASKLYRTDGNVSEEIKNNVSIVGNIAKTDNLIFFASKSNNDFDLWKSDGTPSGTEKVKTLITVTTNASAFVDINILAGKTKCYVYHYYYNNFYYEDKIEHWVSDGTISGTKKLKDLNSSFKSGNSFTPIRVVEDTYYFTAFEESSGFELWKSDGTNVGTKLIKNVNIKVGSSNPNMFIGLNNSVFFTANDIKHRRELWKTEGSGSNTQLYADFNKAPENAGHSAFITCMATLNNAIIAQSNNVMMRIDGVNPPVIIDDVLFHSNPANPEFTKFNGKLYYGGWSSQHEYDYDLWSTDGFTATIVKDLAIGSSVGKPTNFLVSGGFLYFTANNNKQLWKSDGTEAGTFIIKEFTSGSIQSKLFDVNGQIFFSLNDNITGTELWVSNGTTISTKIVRDINVGVGSANPKNLIVFKGYLYFTAYDGSNNNIYKTDGTVNNTVSILARNADKLKVLKDRMYFFVSNSQNVIKEIWRTDGTEYGSYKMLNLYQGVYDTSEFFNVEDRYLVFDVLPNLNTDELWIVDGSNGNIQKVKTIRNTQIDYSFHIEEFFYHNKKLYFAADDGINGKEIWMWDFSCQEHYTVTETFNIDTTIVYDKYIVGVNKIQSNAKVNYNANNYIELRSGFDVNNGNVFTTNLSGCSNISSNAQLMNVSNTEPIFQVSDLKIIGESQPSIWQFLKEPSNVELKNIYYEQYQKGNADKLSWIIQTDIDKYVLKLTVDDKNYLGYLSKK